MKLALGSDDDYDILNSKFSQTIRDKKGEIDENDSEGGYTSIDEDELLPLSAVWDMDSKMDSNNNDDNQLQLQQDVSEDESSSDEESSSSSDENEVEENPFDEISDDEGDLELNNITSTLLKESSNATLKRLDNYGAGEENEFVLPTTTNGNASKSATAKLSLADMIDVVDDKEAVASATLIKGKSTTTAIPLPERIQKRHERKAAYEISKDEVNKWKDTIQQNRRAEHLSFPLNAPTEHNHATAFTRITGAPQTELQEKVDKMLKESNLVDPQKNSTFEELATAKMSSEEMKKKTAEMRLMRELMFREERKARRLKKIKSKSYHRIKKRELLRNRELAGISDESDDDHEAARARERMTLKHKTHSKWAKDMIKHGMTNHKETREEMEEMLRQGERLKEKILDRGDESDREVNLSDIENDNEEENTAKQNLGKTGVMGMAFMKNAEAKQKEANKETIAKLRAMEVDGDLDPFNSDVDETAIDGEVQVNKGRRIYTPGNLESRKELNEVEAQAREEIEIDNSRSLENRLKKNNVAKTASGLEIHNIEDSPEKEESTPSTTNKESSNPWLNDDDDEDQGQVKHSSKVNVIDKDSSKFSKSAQKIEKEMNKQNRKSKKSKNADDELLLDASDSNSLKIIDPYGGSDNEDTGFMFKQQEVIAEASFCR